MMPTQQLATFVQGKTSCRILMRSAPEVHITGIIHSFDMQCIPSLLVVETAEGRRILNMQDVSLIAELPNKE